MSVTEQTGPGPAFGSGPWDDGFGPALRAELGEVDVGDGGERLRFALGLGADEVGLHHQRVERRQDLSDGLRLEFAPSADTIALIARAVEAERHCCRFLRFGMTVEPDGGPVFLELTGPAGTRDFLSDLFEG